MKTTRDIATWRLKSVSGILFLIILTFPGCAARQAEVASTQSEVSARPAYMASWYAGCLVMGDFHPREDGSILYANEPHYLARLVAMGQDAGPVLVDLLENDTSTPFIYVDKLVFTLSGFSDGAEVHNATIADLADWGLRAIYNIDVGFRSHLPPESRKKLISRWSEIVASAARS